MTMHGLLGYTGYLTKDPITGVEAEEQAVLSALRASPLETISASVTAAYVIIAEVPIIKCPTKTSDSW